jgi:hypothetical protein
MRLPVLLSCGWLVLALCGCAGYKLGPTGDVQAGARSIQVNFFQNQTQEPRLVESVNQALRRVLQQDGTYRLDTKGEGDLIMSGRIVRFDRSPITYQPGDILTVRDYSLSIGAKVTVTERSTGRVVFDRDVAGFTTIRVGNDLSSAERQAVPLIAQDMATRISSLLVNGAW